MPNWTMTASESGMVTVTVPDWAGALNFERSDDAFINYDPQSIPKHSPTGVFIIGPFKAGRHIIRVSQAGGVPNFADYVTVPSPQPSSSSVLGTIADNGDVATNAAWMKDAGLPLVREWISFDAATGKLTNEAKIDRLNAYLAAGIRVIATLTPTTKATTMVPCDMAVAAIIARCDKRVIWQILNEPNIAEYWPFAEWRGAFRYASIVSTKLRAAGFQTASPCLTTGDAPSQFEDCWKQVIADGTANYNFVDAHLYTANAAAVDGYLARYKSVADKVGVPLIVSEWGHTSKDAAKTQADLPAFVAALKKHTAMSAFFIGAYIEKHAAWPALIDKTGARTALFGEFKRLTLSSTK